MSRERETDEYIRPYAPALLPWNAARTPEPLTLANLPPYRVALPLQLSGAFDPEGVPVELSSAGERRYQPSAIAEHGLALWNAYLISDDYMQREAFLAQARWISTQLTPVMLSAQETSSGRAGDTAPAANDWLSARALGASMALLTRAYWLAGDTDFMTAAHGAAQLCGRDILDGGVASCPGTDGVFFETEATYPAAHSLLGHMEALEGLCDYVDLAGRLTGGVLDVTAMRAINAQGMGALHTLLTYFDTGRWTRANLLHGTLASPAEHALHVAFLTALSTRCGCAQCARSLERWRGYTRSPRRSARKDDVRRDGRRRRALVDGDAHLDAHLYVCAPITAFPIQGGMRTVVRGFQHVMLDEWKMEYLAASVGAHGPETVIQSFGLPRSIFGASAMSPSQFPNVWRYVWRGWRALRAHLRAKEFSLLLPQDGVFTGAFAAIAGRMAGVRVVVVDHGNVTLPRSAVYRQERVRALRALPVYRRPVERLRLALYWPSLRFLSAVTAKYADHFLAAGDDVAQTWINELGVPPWRVTLFPFLVKTHQFAPANEETRLQVRAQLGVAADALLITMVNRLAPEKGIDIALEGVRAFIDMADQDVRQRVRCLIVGEGPLRTQIEERIATLRLDRYCVLFGEADESTVARLLGVSDVFLYTGTRAINSMAVLEAMAAGCAVVASTAPEVIARYLDERRGIAIPPRSPQAIRDALTQLASDDTLRASMGRRARRYVQEHHTEDALRRALRSASMWRTPWKRGG
jgi:glycosyltransferase involved in cell wall biosynthesis